VARKFCPSCNKLNGGSATQCACGHSFAVSTIATRPTTKRCPACQNEQPMLLQVCGCGHEFDDVRALREALQERVRVGWSYIALGAAALMACAAIAIGISLLWLFGAFGGIGLVVRGFSVRADARAQLSEIRTAARALPTAKVIR
jgi:hypothetical protein